MDDLSPTPKLTRAEAARRNGAKSRGPTSERGKRTSLKNAFKTGLYARSVESFPPSDQDLYREYTLLLTNTYHPEDAVELDLIHQLALNRLRFFRFQSLEARAHDTAEPLETLTRLHRILDALDRAYHRAADLIARRRRKGSGANKRITVCWVDPRTGKPWTPKTWNPQKTEEQQPVEKSKTNPVTPTKQIPHPPFGHSFHLAEPGIDLEYDPESKPTADDDGHDDQSPWDRPRNRPPSHAAEGPTD